MNPSAPIEIRCPGCGRFLMEVSGYGRVVCAQDGLEVTVATKEHRQATRQRDRYPVAGVG